MASQTRAKMGYLKYDTMIQKISSGEIDAYDVNFSPDTKECYIVDADLNPWAVKSRIYTFSDVESANTYLNQATDTYAGQIVAILEDEKYRGYIVNNSSGTWVVSPLSEYNGKIDYNTLGNQPITNLVGSLDSPINAENLNTGIYKVKGQYIISSKLETVFLSASDTILIVRHDEGVTHVKRITVDEINDYDITEESVLSSTLVTSAFIESQGYATQNDIDNKIAALDLITRNEASEYIDNAIALALDTTLDEKIDLKIDEKIQEIPQSEIDGLFN